MEIPLNAQVEYSEGLYWHAVGRSASVLVNPVTERVTHVVVREDESPNTEYLVPVELVAETNTDRIRLLCTKVELEKLDPFVKTEFVKDTVLNYAGYGSGFASIGSPYYFPYITSDVKVPVFAEIEQIPPDELAVRRGTHVEATDGKVGHVDEFVINPETGQITHLVMREGHLWGQKDVLIPVSALGETHDDTVFLKLDKHQVEALPTFSVKRLWS